MIAKHNSLHWSQLSWDKEKKIFNLPSICRYVNGHTIKLRLDIWYGKILVTPYKYVMNSLKVLAKTATVFCLCFVSNLMHQTKWKVAEFHSVWKGSNPKSLQRKISKLLKL